MKKTLVIGASENIDRYSNKAIRSLLKHGHEVLAIGAREGIVEGVKIGKEKLAFENVDTVTMYLGPQNQTAYYDYIISLKPQRVIFNPGTENPAFQASLERLGIEATVACTLVLLSISEY